MHTTIGNEQCSLSLSWDRGMPVVDYWGSAEITDWSAIERGIPHGSLDVAVRIGLVAEESSGFAGRPGIAGHRPDGTAWSPSFVLSAEPRTTESEAHFSLIDTIALLSLELSIVCHESGVVVVDAAVTNIGDSPYFVQRLSPSLPTPQNASELMEFEGRWCLEYQAGRKRFAGQTVIENRRGRTSHDRAPTVIAGTAGFGEQHGEVWTANLAWSGNFSIAAETLLDGQRHLQAAELLLPGEVQLQPGESYAAPSVVAAYSSTGLSGLSNCLHRWLRSQRHWPTADRPRPVTLNTWEAVYFRHDLATLAALADVGASIGVERFVLDDGWFGSRRDDTSGLGDWTVSEDVWPNGLLPLADHVRSLGMEFGLWFEPEMVNPNSDLYRAHPEWALTTDGYSAVLGRNQLVLDLGRDEVVDYLLEAISAVVTECGVSYIKWDMNRDVVQGSGATGSAGVHRHVKGLYRLLDRLLERHTSLEIESCSSGGARIDFGILSRTVRVWASDSNDAVDRQSIQRGIGTIYPPEAIGSHVGPPTAHTTRRTQSLSFRAATAFFSHFGIEWNVMKASPAYREALAGWISLHKEHRNLLHSGEVVRVETSDPSSVVHGVVAQDGTRALFAFFQISSEAHSLPDRVRLAGLDADANYAVSKLATPGRAISVGRTTPAWVDHEVKLSGRELMRIGIQPPAMVPESALFLQLIRV